MQPWCNGKKSGIRGEAVPIPIQSLLGDWECCLTSTGMKASQTKLLRMYRENQLDALRLCWTGIVAGTDGSVDWKNEHMGAGYVTGTEQEPETLFSACVGGPLSTQRAEEASLLQLLIDLRGRSSTPLLVFVNCLVLLDIM